MLVVELLKVEGSINKQIIVNTTMIPYIFNVSLHDCAFRWPLVIDTSPQTSTFLRYRDTNFINALNPRNMDPDVIRISLLGAIR